MLDEQRRQRMINAFTESHGPETAMSLSESLFSNDFATKEDLEPLATKADLKALGARLDNRIDVLTERIDGLDTRLTERIDHCATKEGIATLTGRIDGLDTRLDGLDTRLTGRIDGCATKADLKSEMNRQLRWLITTLVAFLGVMVSAIGVTGALVIQAINNTP